MSCVNEKPAIIIAGSSITECQAWPTWAYYVQKVFQWDHVIDTSIKGMGNEHILFRAVDAARDIQNPFFLIQLTTIDKWDWYVDDQDIVQKLLKEKHPLSPITDQHDRGFWSTGSHFPLAKDYFRQNYYSHDYFVWKTLMLLQWFQGICANNNWRYYILFDSPIFAVTENQLNKGLADYEKIDDFLQSPLCSAIAGLWPLENIYLPGLIGYAKSNDLPWWSDRFKGHPGSLVHYLFTKHIIVPQLQKYFKSRCDITEFWDEAIKWQELVNGN